ncbi:MAG: NTP transferase domain-containing protein [Nitrososphaera sp.]|nr:NTP transferase domain-containing protein [Nitrososphaera sp.]
MNIVIPAAGVGSRFANAGYQHPKPFIPIKGKSMLDWVIENVSKPTDKVYVILRAEHLSRINETEIPFRRNVAIIPLSEPTAGAACTVLKAKPFINNQEPLVIANCDQYVRYDRRSWDFFCEEARTGMMVFHAPPNQTQWSFARLGCDGEIEEIAEKKPISNIATVGVYFFGGGYVFCHAAETMIEANDRTNGEFYVAPVFNYVQFPKIPFFVEAMFGLGEPWSFAENYEKVGT